MGGGWGGRSGATDAEYVAAARAATTSSKIGVLANPAPFTQPEEITSLAPQLDFIRIGARADDVGIAVSNVAHALQCGLEVWFQLMRSSRCMPEQLLEQAKYVEGMGAAVVYLVDTAGAFLPEQVAEIIGAFKAALKIRVGFHGHNNF